MSFDGEEEKPVREGESVAFFETKDDGFIEAALQQQPRAAYK